MKLVQKSVIDNNVIKSLAKSCNVSEFLARLLVMRSIDTPQKVQKFLYGKLSDLKSPFDFDDMDKVIERIKFAINSNEKILIPDYWKYPKNRILHCEKWSADFKIDLPEDIYVFDDTFSWSIVYTHEEMKPGKRYCLHIDRTIT